MKYMVIVEEGPTSFGAYVPDLPGCIAAASSREELLLLISQAMALHLEELRARGDAIPEAISSSEFVEFG